MYCPICEIYALLWLIPYWEGWLNKVWKIWINLSKNGNWNLLLLIWHQAWMLKHIWFSFLCHLQILHLLNFVSSIFQKPLNARVPTAQQNLNQAAASSRPSVLSWSSSSQLYGDFSSKLILLKVGVLTQWPLGDLVVILIHKWLETYVRNQRCGYCCPGAKAPGHQYPQCWLCAYYIELHYYISYQKCFINAEQN